jgi:K+-transporting ATPase ATPase C chain
VTSLLRPTLVLLAAFTLLTGIAWPVAFTGLAQLLFPAEANGSLLTVGGRVVGSELVGQPFDDPRYAWGRPSATTPFPYNGGASTGSNLGPSNPALAEAVRTRVAALRAVDPTNTAAPPVDLVTTSGSGLDPHVSPEAALYQAARIARARGLDEAQVRALVAAQVEPRTLGLFGEPRVNVLRLNVALDALSAGKW